jgi:hypothetical protein
MNKHLLRKLVSKKAWAAIKEIERRDRIVERPNIVYSTQQTQPTAAAVSRNRGTIEASSAIRSRSAFEGGRLRGARSYATVGGELVPTSAFGMRIMKK